MSATSAASFRVLLSHEELAYVAGLLGATPAVGIDDNPLAGLSEVEVRLALAVAGRGLRARRLVQEDDAGRAHVQSDLLAGVGAYCYPQRVVTLYHWLPGAALPSACYGYVRQETVVLHQRPAPALHDLQLLATSAALVDALLGLGAVTGVGAASGDSFQLPAALLDELRRPAAGGIAGVAGVGLADAAQQAAASRFAATLAAQPQVTAFTTLRSAPGSASGASSAGGVERHEFTFLRRNGAAWLLTAAGAPDVVQVRSVDTGAVRALLAGALAG